MPNASSISQDKGAICINVCLVGSVSMVTMALRVLSASPFVITSLLSFGLFLVSWVRPLLDSGDHGSQGQWHQLPSPSLLSTSL